MTTSKTERQIRDLSTRLTLTDCGDPDGGSEDSAAAFLRDNLEDSIVWEAVRALLAGEVTEVPLGGGAAPESVLRIAEGGAA